MPEREGEGVAHIVINLTLGLFLLTQIRKRKMRSQMLPSISGTSKRINGSLLENKNTQKRAGAHTNTHTDIHTQTPT